MKKLVTVLLTSSALCCLASRLTAQIPPLPPLNTAPLWEINIYTQTGAVLVDTITYGRRYCLCGHDYVAIVRNGVEEIMYMRQDTDQAFYLLDTEDCASERLLYDYSSDTANIPVENILSIPDSFDVFTFALSPVGTYGPLQLPALMLDFNYQLGPFTLHSAGYWIRGVGDISHPLFPVFNNYNSSAQEATYALRRLTVDHLVWYEAAAEPPSYAIIYVDQDAASGLQNGSSWTDAYTRLDVALQHAQAGDLVWVAEGVYQPTTGTDRGAVFELRDGIQLYGGFSGTETNLLDRGDPALHPTVLSGDIGLPGDSTDNSYHVLRIQDVRDFAVVDGFTIRDGNALGGNIAFPFVENGAGILIYSAVPTTDTANIVLKNNILTHHAAGSGAALSFDNGYATPARLRISQCTISDNFALNWGGGLFIPPALTQPLKVSISESSFQTNYAHNSDGGAIYDYHALTNWEIVNTVFAENGVVVGDGGGAMGLFHIQGDKHIQILNCEFRDNFCQGNGAGLGYLHYGGPGRLQLSIQKTRFLRNTSFANGGGAVHIGTVADGFIDFDCMDCDFIENSSLNWGGAVSMQLYEVSAPCTIMFDRCEFTSNQSAGSVGGAIYISGEGSDSQADSLQQLFLHINNSILSGNKGLMVQDIPTIGSGIVAYINNCTLVDNGPIVFSKPHRPAFNDTYRCDLNLKNSIIWEPDLPFWQIMYNGYPLDLSVYDYELDHCLISADSCDLPGGDEACMAFPNFFNIDPLFVDAGNGDYRLKHCSPLLNQGVDIPGLGPFDLNGQPRIREEVVDLGAYEQGTFTTFLETATTNLACASDSTGNISLNTLNGLPPITYTLTAQGVNLGSTEGGQFANLPPNDYQVLAVDALACADTLDFTISSPPPLAIAVTAQASMPDQHDGAILFDSITGGMPPYQLFFNSEVWNGMPITGLSPGYYHVSGIDAQDCPVDTLVEVELINDLFEAEDAPLGLTISPNPLPVGHLLQLTLSRPAAHPLLVEVRNATGARIKTAMIPAHATEANIFTPVQAGLYLILLKDPVERMVTVRKVVVD